VVNDKTGEDGIDDGAAVGRFIGRIVNGIAVGVGVCRALGPEVGVYVGQKETLGSRVDIGEGYLVG
jgi:hypothetical protein